MNKAFLFTLCIIFNLGAFSQKIQLTNNGTSSYKIVASGADAASMNAAKTLAAYINKISGATIPVTDDNSAAQQAEVLIGNNKHINALHLNLDTKKIHDNEYVMKSSGNTLLLYGNRDSDIINCVYYFIEKYLGCDMLASDAAIIPHMQTINLAAINEDYSPAFTYRDLYYKDAYDSTYTKFNSIDHFDAGGQNRKWGEIWSSSFMYVIPAKTYFKTHPEYFALDDKGQRIPDQLDLTNPDLFNEYVKNFRQLMKRFPNSKIWSVAANDASAPNYCHCPNCTAINNREGTPMGTLLTFVNKIAAQFPDKIIATQAYRYYEEPTKTIKPAPNVLIVEAGSIELNHAIPYQSATDAATVTYRRRLNQWLALTPNVRIWDYVTDYSYLMCPFPNLQVQQKNLQYYASLGIKDIFMQGNISAGGEFPELRAYILAKLLWNPNTDYNKILNNFLTNYYGKAGSIIKQYLDATATNLVQSKIPLISQDHPHKHYKGFLAPDLLVSYNKIFDQAEAAVSNNADQLERVKVARLSLIYAMLEMSKMANVAGSTNVSASVGNTHNKTILDLLNYFVSMCKKHGIEKMSEGATTVDYYQQDFSKFVNNNFKTQ